MNEVIAILKTHDKVTRAELVQLTGLTDRQARAEIEKARRGGAPIISDPQNSGYWLARSENELTNFLQRYMKRATKMLGTASRMKHEFLRGNQYELDV